MSDEKKKAEAERQRELRRARKEAGLIDVRVWILPEHKARLLAYVKRLGGGK